MEFKTKTLSNGLTVAAEISPTAQTAAVGFFVRTGSRDETENISGVSHFLEHMMFKGTDKLTALEVNEAFDRTGAKFNAFTSEENTVYYAAVLPEYLGEVTDLWTQLMRPSLRDDDFNMEKNVILEEIAMYKDMPQFDVMDQARSLHFKGHPCGNSVLGSNDSITALKADQMREYFKRRYAPNNITVAGCGNMDFDKLCKIIEDKCGPWQPYETSRKISFFNGTSEIRKEEKDSLFSEHICLVSPCVSAQDPRRFAASILAMIIGDYTGSRYFWTLIDTATAEIALMQFESMDGVGALYSYIRYAKENSDRIAGIVDNLFTELKEKGITQDELHKAQNKVLSALTIKSEQPMGRLVDVGFNWVYSKQYRSLEDDIESIKSVTVNDVNMLIQEFDPGRFTRFCLSPAKKSS